MRKLLFSKLFLLSQKEKSAFKLDLSSSKTLLIGMNGGGKSAILKSLYNTLGARPHKIDKRWSAAKVISVVEFSIDGMPFAATKNGSTFPLFDGRGNRLLETKHVVKDLGPILANKLDFRLILTKKGTADLFIPPPSFIFAPYYVDQDNGWTRSWSSFEDLRMVDRAAKSLSDYHSGIRSNAFYAAKADKERFLVEQRSENIERKAVETAVEKLTLATEGAPLALSLADFQKDIERLLKEAQKLHEQQAAHRQKLGRLTEERRLWTEELAVLDRAIAELGEDVDALLTLPHEVDCPMCGQHYANDIVAQFDMVNDRQTLQDAREATLLRFMQTDHEIKKLEDQLNGTIHTYDAISSTLAATEKEITLREVIAAEGRTEALAILSQRLAEHDIRLAELSRLIEDAEQRMKDAIDVNKANEIKEFYNARIEENAAQLDVPLGEEALSLQGIELTRSIRRSHCDRLSAHAIGRVDGVSFRTSGTRCGWTGRARAAHAAGVMVRAS